MLPSLPGIPWWGAILVAVTATAIGFAFDAGSGTKGLTAAFGVCYVTGCVLAVLAVRQSGVFTTVIQPPLILFAAVPGAYFLFHGDEIKGIKDILINCGYPLIERFPLMFFTAITVLVIGVARWYLGHSAGRRTAAEEDPDTPATRSARRSAVADSAAETAAETPVRRSRRRAAEAPESDDEVDEPRSARRSRTATTRPRRDRAPETEIIPSVTDRPRRSRPPVDGDEPRRRSRDEVRERRASAPAERRSATSSERRSAASSERRSAERRSAAPSERRGQDRRDRTPRGDADRPVRRERLERTERADRAERYDRPERRRRTAEYEPFETFDRYEPDAGRSSTGSHHPVSRVRYRGADDGESRVEQRSTPRRQRSAEADAWEYDV